MNREHTITALTESGADYRFHHGFWYHRGYNWGKVWTFKVVAPEEVEGMTEAELHAYMRDVPQSDYPEVGKRMYISNRDGWRLSTVVTEIVEEDEDA